MEWLFSLLVRTVNFGRFMDPEFYGRPFLSGISERSVESGLDICSPDGERGNAWITAFTWVENPDSLVAIKKLVFDEQRISMDQLIQALDKNFEGCEDIRRMCLEAPKFGNDNPVVDDVASDMFAYIAAETEKYHGKYGRMMAGMLPVTAHVPFDLRDPIR